MQRILVPVDGSEASSRALTHAIALAQRSAPAEIEVLNVQLPVDGLVREFVSQEMIDKYHRTEADAALAPARGLLAASSVPNEAWVQVGRIAETIVEHAAKRRCEVIVMGTRGLGAVSGMVMGSVATRVVHLAEVPVTLVK